MKMEELASGGVELELELELDIGAVGDELN